jgi:E3 ubiquitin-protein ligase BRE1
MRAKEGIDAQAKMAQRTVEKQNRLLEKAQEVEKALQSQITTQEQAVTQLKNALSDLKRQVVSISSEKSTLEHQLQHAQKHLSEAQQIMHIRVAESASDRDARRKVEEEAEVAAKTIRKLRDKQEALIAAPGVDDMSASEWQMREERDKLLVSIE